jgi:hypothetical protein
MHIRDSSSKATDGSRSAPRRGLRDITLTRRNQNLLETALSNSGGDAAWQARKESEAFDLLALSQRAPAGRLRVEMLDLEHNLRALLLMRVPVSCRPDAKNVLPVTDHALLGLDYPRDVLCSCLPGPSFVQILQPWEVWHAQVSPRTQVLCLADRLPRNIPVRELVLMTYNALAMTTWQVSETDTAGVLNVEAARWWAANLHRAPLSTTPFLGEESQATSNQPERTDR